MKTRSNIYRFALSAVIDVGDRVVNRPHTLAS